MRRNALALSGALLMAMIGRHVHAGARVDGAGADDDVGRGDRVRTPKPLTEPREEVGHGDTRHQPARGIAGRRAGIVIRRRVHGYEDGQRLDDDHTGFPERIEEPTGSRGRPWRRR